MTNNEFVYNGVQIEVDLELDYIIIQGIKKVPEGKGSIAVNKSVKALVFKIIKPPKGK